MLADWPSRGRSPLAGTGTLKAATLEEVFSMLTGCSILKLIKKLYLGKLF
jgi:hypothetical protein